MEWEPIKREELELPIRQAETIDDELWNLWNLIKIEPEKWQEDSFGEQGGGFWVVAIFGNNVIWYNDIEDGFNISKYSKYGKIDEYWADQASIWESVRIVYRMIEEDYEPMKPGPPEPFDPINGVQSNQ